MCAYSRIQNLTRSTGFYCHNLWTVEKIDSCNLILLKNIININENTKREKDKKIKIKISYL